MYEIFCEMAGYLIFAAIEDSPIKILEELNYR
jgi:hypothetical protein